MKRNKKGRAKSGARPSPVSLPLSAPPPGRRNTVLTVSLLLALTVMVAAVLAALENLKAAALKDCPTCYSIPGRVVPGGGPRP